MSTVTILAIAAAGLATCGAMSLKSRALDRVRARMRALAEISIIRKRRLERGARTPRAFEEAWRDEVAALRRAHLRWYERCLIGRGDLRLMLEAEFATFLPPEIASWTFLERAGETAGDYRGLALRCLAAQGWTAGGVRGLPETEEVAHLSDGVSEIVVLVPRRPLTCWSIHRAGLLKNQFRATPMVVLANGDVPPAVAVLARETGIALLHTSQTDLLRAHARATAGRGDGRAGDSAAHPARPSRDGFPHGPAHGPAPIPMDQDDRGRRLGRGWLRAA